ncbi:MAG: 4a-hydroxytetrahydrobiopterin dehydratase [Chloroflexi bacterium CFX6]|nr:4a-hydroxytetrahydrobiopterin dehydratase [Chloroflexi bacterium CFX6]
MEPTLSRQPLDASAVAAALTGLPGWTVRDGKLHKAYVFGDFVAAFGFMTRAALHAERMNHHPEWCNVYRTVRVDLVTHSAGGITALDVALAKAFDTVAG